MASSLGEDAEKRLILVANPGSASRKYALYDQQLGERGQLHFETTDGRIVCTIHQDGKSRDVATEIAAIEEAPRNIEAILRSEGVLGEDEVIGDIGLRIVAPSSYFIQDHLITPEVTAKLKSIRDLAPIHIDASLVELQILNEHFGEARIVGVSDSAFHATKPNYAWNYGINIHDADQYDIKRFGYHGLSVAASIDTLWDSGKLPPRVIVCHLGSGSSVTGVYHGRSIDTSMGFTPLDGVVMATRSGSIDFGAVRALKKALELDDTQIERYLNESSGLLGLSGTSDIRELITREADGDHYAHLALTTLIHSLHKAIGQMLVALNGADLLVFTGTVGERSAEIRKRLVAHLEFTDFILDGNLNQDCDAPTKPTYISQPAKSRPIVVIPTNEALEIARHTQKLLSVVE